jgi:hypothetical protein
MWLNDLCFDRNLFPDNFHIFPSDRVSSKKSRDGGVLIAVSSKFRACKRRYDLQFYDECVWVEIPTQNGRNLLIDNHNFSPDTKPDIISQYFLSLEQNLDTQNHKSSAKGEYSKANKSTKTLPRDAVTTGNPTAIH